MKVNIGPYVYCFGPYQIAKKVFFWVEEYPLDEKYEDRWDYKLYERFGDWLSSTWVSSFCQWLYSKQKRRVKVHIDRYDIWSADHTLALIIEPLLKELKDVKHGSPNVDDEDVPDELKSINAAPPENDWATDDNHHARWDWALNEMIWAFEQHNNENADDRFHTGEREHLWQKVDTDGNKIGEAKPLSSREKVTDEEKSAGIVYQLILGPNDTSHFDREGWEKWSARKANGFRLFGKYYQALWD